MELEVENQTIRGDGLALRAELVKLEEARSEAVEARKASEQARGDTEVLLNETLQRGKELEGKVRSQGEELQEARRRIADLEHWLGERETTLWARNEEFALLQDILQTKETELRNKGEVLRLTSEESRHKDLIIQEKDDQIENKRSELDEAHETWIQRTRRIVITSFNNAFDQIRLFYPDFSQERHVEICCFKIVRDGCLVDPVQESVPEPEWRLGKEMRRKKKRRTPMSRVARLRMGELMMVAASLHPGRTWAGMGAVVQMSTDQFSPSLLLKT